MKFPRPRITIRRLMVAVAIVAVNFGLIRGAERLRGGGSEYVVLLAYAFAPSLTLLTLVAVGVIRGLVKIGHASSFSTGYLLLSGLASLGLALALAPTALTAYVSIPHHIPGWAQEDVLKDMIESITIVAMFALPQVLPGLIGGSLATWQGLTIVLRRRERVVVTGNTVSGEV